MGRNVIWRPLVALAALVFFASAAAHAAPPPPGSYRDSCNNIRAFSNVLRARCERNNGRTVRTQLNAYSNCVGDISNYDGRLICLRRNQVPAGSWSKDCVNPRLVAPDVFGADCRSLRGGRIAAQIPLNQCPSGLTANRGQLVCEEPRGDIILYEHVNYRGRAFATSADVPYLSRPFNDIASSVRIARGTWQVCTDANYRGRCVTLRADTANLIPLGLNDRISSLRRLPETQLPGGSWQQSCRNANLTGPMFTAQCLDRRGRYRTSTLDLRACRGRNAVNDDGTLACDDDQGENNAPAGSYQESCRNIQFDGRRLRAQCRNHDRNWRDTDLDTRDCDRDEEIVNDDGDLACRLRGGGAQEGQEPPQGGYRRSCREIEFDGRYLTAQCTDERGKWRNARLDVRDCDDNAEIVSDDGDLVCKGRGPGGYNPGPFPPPTGGNNNPGPLPPGTGNPPPINPDSVNPGAVPPPGGGTPGNAPTPGAGPAGSPPPGPGTQDGGGNPSTGGPPAGGGPGGITLFENPNYEGKSKTFTTDVPDLAPLGWSDLASSLKIARGRWEVCEDVNFAGRCQTFAGDQANLPPELSDKISSVRHVRRGPQGGEPNE